MLSTTERNERIEQIRSLPDRIIPLAQDLTVEQLDAPGAEGEWSLRQVIHHIADAHLNAYLRTKLILTEEKPILKPFNQDAWARLPDTTRSGIQPSLWIIQGVHQRWAELLADQPEENWQRCGIHLEAGKVSLDDILKLYAGHGETHLAQLQQLRSQLAERK